MFNRGFDWHYQSAVVSAEHRGGSSDFFPVIDGSHSAGSVRYFGSCPFGIGTVGAVCRCGNRNCRTGRRMSACRNQHITDFVFLGDGQSDEKFDCHDSGKKKIRVNKKKNKKRYKFA